jgi:hypothetical protein
MQKPIVHFKISEGCFIPKDNSYALVSPVNHPDSTNVSNTKQVITSKVLSVIQENNQVVEFETENTVYIIDRTK